MIITQQIIRDALYYKGDCSARQLTLAMGLPEAMLFQINAELTKLVSLGDAETFINEHGNKAFRVTKSVRVLLDYSNRVVNKF